MGSRIGKLVIIFSFVDCKRLARTPLSPRATFASLNMQEDTPIHFTQKSGASSSEETVM
ncbi:hypothetical protein KSC_006090 [Ktedonobacter sp. SOSP1-52]|nr:hypothetical protein KSC_006090 [Ktedonobacter sp. SOSP1-52]